MKMLKAEQGHPGRRAARASDARCSAKNNAYEN
jgi:hypothetical protein